MRLGSTERVASTVRPDACSIGSTIERASSSESSYAVVSSTASRFWARATSASSSALISASSPARPFSATSRTKLRTRSSAPAASCSRTRPSRRVDLRVAEERAELGHLLDRAGERGEVRRDLLEPPLLLRGLEERAGVHALRDGHGG